MNRSLPSPPLWRIDPNDAEAEAVLFAASLIRNGGVVVYPTETFYGLGGDPGNAQAIDRIYRIKGRGFDKPLPLIAADADAVREAVLEWPVAAERLARAFWPGPLTLVLKARPHWPARLHAGTGTIAVRVSPHPIARRLSATIGGLIVSTSANRAGEPPCTTPEALAPEFLAETDGVLDAGELPGQQPSTIIDVSSGPEVTLIRSGRLSRQSLEAVLEPNRML